MSIPRPDLWGFSFFFFSAEYIRSKKVQISQNDLNWRKITKKKKEQKKLGQVFVRAHRRRAKFHGLTRKNGVDFGRGIRFRHLTWTSRYPNSPATGVHSNQDLIWWVKIGVHMGFWVHRGSWLLWPPVNSRVFATYQIMLGWKTCRYSLWNRRTPQLKANNPSQEKLG